MHFYLRVAERPVSYFPGGLASSSGSVVREWRVPTENKEKHSGNHSAVSDKIRIDTLPYLAFSTWFGKYLNIPEVICNG